MPNSSGKEELRSVRVADIAEFPTALGSRCFLLRKLGLDAYVNSEEELAEALHDSAKRPECLNMCINDSRCKAFWRKFQQGVTPFTEDAYSLLPQDGIPGQFRFQCVYSPQKLRKCKGDIAVLWVQSPHGNPPSRFDFGPTALGVGLDTHGEARSVFPGLSYRVNVSLYKSSLWGFRKRYLVQSEVSIDENHAKARIWLLSGTSGKLLTSYPVGVRQLNTIYRFGCWRNHHLKSAVWAEDRLKIQRWRSENMSPTIMAEKLGRNKATIYRELKRGRTDELDKNLNYEYDALLAHQRYQESFVCRGRKKVECGSIKIISHAHVKNGQLVEESHDDP